MRKRHSAVTRLDQRRSRNFLLALADQPFVAVVFADGAVKVYTKEIELTDECLRTIQAALTEIQQEGDHADQGEEINRA